MGKRSNLEKKKENKKWWKFIGYNLSRIEKYKKERFLRVRR